MADVCCAFALSQVDQVVAMPGVIPLPRSANHVLGAINLHGTTVPVIDLHRLLGREPVGIRPDQYLLVLRGSTGRLAARCDRVDGLARTAIQPPPGARLKANFVLGLAQDADRLLMVLDASALVDARPVPERTIRQLAKNEVGRV